MNKLKIGIVGWGVIADIHAQAIIQADNCQLVSVFTSSWDKGTEIRKKYDVDVFNDYKEFLNSDIDIVSICTPSGTHLEFGRKAAEFGKHVIVEKPIEISLDKAKELIKACKTYNVKLGVIFQNRYLDAVKKIKSIINESLLGKIFHVSADIKWWRSQEYYDSGKWRGTFELDGGGTLMNQSIHTIDLLLFLVGEPLSAISFMGTFMHNRIEVEDSAVAIIKFKNGAIGSIEASTSIKPAQPRRIEIHGEKGTVVLEGDEAIIRIEGYRNMEEVSLSDSGADSPLSGFKTEPHKMQFEEIVKSILANKEPEVNGTEGLKALAVIMALYQSSKTGRIVDIEKKMNCAY